MSEDPNVRPEPNYGPLPYGTPPEWPYGAPPLSNDTKEPLARPLPLGEAVRQLPNQYIKVLTKPGAITFAQEQGKAAWNIIWVQLVISIITSVLAGLVVFNTTIPNSLANSHISSQIIQMVRTYSSVFALSYIILVPTLFFIGVGIYHLLAKAFGGQGTFLAYSYCNLLFAVPLGIINSVLSIIGGVLGLPSFVTSLVAFVPGFYSIVLLILMTMGIHRLSGGKATLAVLLLPIIFVGLGFVLIFVLIFGSIILFFAGHHVP